MDANGDEEQQVSLSESPAVVPRALPEATYDAACNAVRRHFLLSQHLKNGLEPSAIREFGRDSQQRTDAWLAIRVSGRSGRHPS